MLQISDVLKYRIVAFGALVVVGGMLSGCDTTGCSDCDGPTYTDAFSDGTATSTLDTLSTERPLVIRLQAVPKVNGTGRLQLATRDPVIVQSPNRDTLQSEETVAVAVRFTAGEREIREIELAPFTVDDNLSLHPRAVMDSVLVEDSLFGPDAPEVRSMISHDVLNPGQDLGHLLIEARR